MPSFTGCGGSCHGAITSLGALQGFTFIALGFFFKDPAGSGEHRLAAQFDALVAWCSELGRA